MVNPNCYLEQQDKSELKTNTEQLNSAVFEGTLEVKIAGVVVNCPFVEVNNIL